VHKETLKTKSWSWLQMGGGGFKQLALLDFSGVAYGKAT
jgi:hypothetical protein